MITLEEFRARLVAGETDELLDEVFLAGGAQHVEQSEIDFIQAQLSRRFRVPEDGIDVVITGSAKTGFSLVEKRKNGTQSPRYRPFSA